MDLLFNHVHLVSKVVPSTESLVMRVFCPARCTIQGDLGRKFQILWGDIMGLCEKIVRMDMCLIPNVYRDRAVWIYKYKNVMRGNKKLGYLLLIWF